MKAFSFISALVAAFFVILESCPASPSPIAYRLIEGSYFLDDCLICGRPSIFRPIRGTFDMLEVSRDTNAIHYTVTNINFAATVDPTFRIRGDGAYEVGYGTNAIQNMIATLNVNGESKLFTNNNPAVERLAPMLDVQLVQTQQNLVVFYSLNIVAAPLRDLWFSSRTNVATTNGSSGLSPGDLLSFSGRVVIPDAELIARLGLMPMSASGGIDALFPTGGGDVAFSFQRDEFSETRGTLRHGDVVSNRGSILFTNLALLANFEPQPVLPDYGLDALFISTNGAVLFSTTTNFVSPRIGELSSGDVLSYSLVNGAPTNQLVRTSQQLLSRFRPVETATDYGLDALYMWPSGEIWFSTELGFDDQGLGPISDGDVLSDQGYRVYRNAELVGGFGAAEKNEGYGLDSLFIVTDVTAPPAGRPLLRIAINPNGDAALDWTATGQAFQVEKAAIVTGPYLPLSALLAGTSFVDSNAVQTATSSFYRVRQW